MNILPKAILFDWDECLVTQGNLIRDVSEKCLKNNLSASDYQKHCHEELITGKSMKHVFPDLFGRERWLDVQEEFYRIFKADHLKVIKLLPGAEQICQFVARHFPVVGIVSNKRSDLLQEEVAYLNLNSYFHVTIGSGDAERDKPFADPIHLALKGLGVHWDQNSGYGSQVLFVGDRLTDLRASQAAKCRFCYVGNEAESLLKHDSNILYFNHLDQLRSFLASLKLRWDLGWGHGRKVKEFGEMSRRRYERYQSDSGESIMLMDASEQPSSISPFIKICHHLDNLGYSVPKILGEDRENNLLIIEDFGDGSFASLISKDPHRHLDFLQLAVDFLIDLHQRPLAESAPEDKISLYEDTSYVVKADLFWQWYRPDMKRELSEESIKEYQDIWRNLLQIARLVPETLVLRDFSCRNLFFLPLRLGVRQCGLIDFQDAVRGPVTEDLLSILTSTRVPLKQKYREMMIARYLDAFPHLLRSQFRDSWTVLLAHRYMRIIGLYSHAVTVHGNTAVGKFLPSTYQEAMKVLENPLLDSLRSWVKAHMPDSFLPLKSVSDLVVSPKNC